MKLTMEFEDADVREMLQQHFERNGFRIRNMDELVHSFGVAYPEGIKVEVDAIPPVDRGQENDPVPATPHGGTDEQIYATEVVRDTPVETVKRSPSPGNPRLSRSDIEDPTFQGIDKNTPVDEEIMQREISHILKNSQVIASDRGRE